MIIEVSAVHEMNDFGKRLAGLLQGGSVIELVGDVGAGKTTLTKAIAKGLGVEEDVQSPSFTISRVYPLDDGLALRHYDFYRLNDAGIMQQELDEAVNDTQTITIIEWADIVSGVLPNDRLTLTITPTSETSRQIVVQAGGTDSQRIKEAL
jgi:tRNA threonylcarbamoyladenosine biosynthesis protein TsaE